MAAEPGTPPTPPGALEEENRRLRRAVEELTILNDLARAIGASHNSQEIMNTIIRRSLRAVNCEQGVITLVDEKANQPMKTLIRTMVSSAEHQPLHLNQSLIGWMYLNKRPLLVNDPSADDRFKGVRWDASIRSLLCVPLLIKSELKGVLTVYNKRGGGFTEEDQRLLAIIAGQSAQIIETARLYEEEQALVHMREELRLALDIQVGLLPKSSPQIPGYDIAGRSIPAEVVGGDYFDFIPMEEDQLAFCLGDISGKGMPAAVLMANLQATIRGQTLLKCSPKECLGRSNTLLYLSTDPQKFATLFYGILDYRNHRLCYCNAGHERPYMVASAGKEAGKPARLDVGGIILGCVEQFPYEETCLPFNRGDLIVVFSDGVTEAMSETGEEYGEERIANLLAANPNESAAGLIEKLVASVAEHAGKRSQTDDITLVAVRRL
ncbi:MAG: PP2C family protein-serine/threonine phosphatase [Candidatus Eisenbacteria bacterium]|nr:PP2C family protein-serine/threonine phosphatase [Candidatus Eisenbacteria bacterium]